jgi:hypothetical protein
MVISYVIKDFIVHNILVDIGNTIDIIFAKAFKQIKSPKIRFWNQLFPSAASKDNK